MRIKTIVAFLLIGGLSALLNPGALLLAGDSAPEIKHRLLIVDESRAQLHYADQLDPSKDWTIKLPTPYRDIQLIGKERILMSTARGYREYSLKTRESVKEVENPRYEGSASVRRLRNGHTIIGCNQNGLSFFELDGSDELVTSATFPTLDTLRLFRLSPRGTLLMGSNTEKVTEVDLKGRILRSFVVPGGKHIYQVLEKPNGNLLAAIGYGCEIVETDSKGAVLRKLGGQPFPEGLVYNFFCGMQVLRNGNTVVCNWTGHGPEDSKKAAQILEFSPDGTLVWKWNDPQRSGSVHGVIVLDDLDTKKLYLDPSVLK